MVYNANEARVPKTKIDDEITVIPELKSIFTDELSLIGRRGKSLL